MNDYKKVTLEHLVLQIESGSRPRGGAKNIEGVYSIGAEHLNKEGGFSFKRPKYISGGYYKKLKKGIVKDRCILMVKDGVTTGRVSFVDKENNFPFKNAAINEHVFQLNIDHTKALSKYVFYYLYSKEGQDTVLKNFRGSTVGGITRDFIHHVTIPLPSLSKQQKIVYLLDEANELRSLNMSFWISMRKLFHSVFLEYFGDPVVNKRQWEQKKIQEVLSVLQTGWSPICEKRQPQTGEWGVLKLSSLTGGFFTLSQSKTLPKDRIPKYNLEVQRGDVLFARKNTLEYIGTSAYIFERNHSSRYIFSDLMFRMQCYRDIMHPIFLWLCMSQKNQRSEIRRLATGTAGTMPNISKKRLLTLPIICPPIELQEKFARRIEEIYEMKHLYEEAHKRSQRMFQTLLRKSF